MLQSEFQERTKLSLTNGEYNVVEDIYNAVKMDKGEFCKWWVKNQKNALFNELVDAFQQEASRHRATNETLIRVNKEFEEYKEKEPSEFAKRIIRANEEGDLRVQEVVEEEFGIGFIIKTKHDAGIPLSEEEIQYMVNKL